MKFKVKYPDIIWISIPKAKTNYGYNSKCQVLNYLITEFPEDIKKVKSEKELKS